MQPEQKLAVFSYCNNSLFFPDALYINLEVLLEQLSYAF